MGTTDDQKRIESEERVIVVDDRRQFVEHVPPAIARYALKRNHARVLYKTPFTIRLAPGLDSCPRPPRNASRPRTEKPAPEVIHVAREFRAEQRKMNQNYFNPAQHMIDVVDFFEKIDRKAGGDGIVWAKSAAARGAQVVVEVKTANGSRIRIPPLRPGDPVCLSKYATFEVLRDAEDLRQNVLNGNLKLMSSQDANAYFQKKASILKTSPQVLMQKAEQSARDSVYNRPLSESEVDTSARIEDRPVAIDDVVNPRLHHLCQQVSPLLRDGERMPVSEFMGELLSLEDSLSLEDLEYIRSQGFYPTVKNWAAKKQAEVAELSGIAPAIDELGA